MIVGTLEEIEVMAVLDRGTPNKESIALKVKQDANLGQYGIMLGIYDHVGNAQPVYDQLFWFGDGWVFEGDWIFVNTGPGAGRKDRSKDDNYDYFSLYWGKTATIFANANVVPILFRVDAVNVQPAPMNLPQLGTADA